MTPPGPRGLAAGPSALQGREISVHCRESVHLPEGESSAGTKAQKLLMLRGWGWRIFV